MELYYSWYVSGSYFFEREVNATVNLHFFGDNLNDIL